jgi:hypothetical protein
MDFKFTVVANEAQFPELVHEEIDPPASCAHLSARVSLTQRKDRRRQFA